MARALIIDDEKPVRELVGALLQKAGWEVTLAAGTVDGLARCYEDPFDLVITDIFMPPVDGFVVLRALKKILPKVPIIVMTGSQLADPQRWASLEPKPDRILRKPFLREELFSLIAEVAPAASSAVPHP